MEKEFIPYELAVKLKELGFDEPCFAYFLNSILQYPAWEKDYSYFNEMSDINPNFKKHEHVLAPTWQSAFRWFRDNHHAFHEVFIDCLPKVGVPLEEDLMFSFTIHLVKEDKLVCGPRDTYRTQEEAEFACLEKLIEIVEEK